MNNLPDEMKIANCKCCLLAHVMRDCKHCPFNVGLVYKTLDAIKRSEVIKEPSLISELKSFVVL